jgi:hypothetical protein
LVTDSALAVNDVTDDPDDAEGAVATTQSPAFTVDSVAVTGWLNDVDEFHDTATWPACSLCTCIVVPEIAATCPVAPGRAAWPAPPRAGALGPAAADELVLVPDDDPLHAASESPAASATAPTARVRRTLKRAGEIMRRIPLH